MEAGWRGHAGRQQLGVSTAEVLVVVVVVVGVGVGRGVEGLEGQRHPSVGLGRGRGEAGVLQSPDRHAHLVQGRLHREGCLKLDNYNI